MRRMASRADPRTHMSVSILCGVVIFCSSPSSFVPGSAWARYSPIAAHLSQRLPRRVLMNALRY